MLGTPEVRFTATLTGSGGGSAGAVELAAAAVVAGIAEVVVCVGAVQQSTLRYGAMAEVTHRLRRPLRRVAVLRIRTTHGRVLSFSELRPATAAAIAGHVAGARVDALGAAS